MTVEFLNTRKSELFLTQTKLVGKPAKCVRRISLLKTCIVSEQMEMTGSCTKLPLGCDFVDTLERRSVEKSWMNLVHSQRRSTLVRYSQFCEIPFHSENQSTSFELIVRGEATARGSSDSSRCQMNCG